MALVYFNIDSQASTLTQVNVNGQFIVNEPGPCQIKNYEVEIIPDKIYSISWLVIGNPGESYQIEIDRPASAARIIVSTSIGNDGIDAGNIKFKI